MRALSHILVATDLSAAACHAYPHAAAWAKAHGARVTLLHVDDSQQALLGEVPGLQYEDLSGRGREEHLRGVCERFEALGVEVEPETARGTPWREILELAEREDADLIVVTKHGEREKNHLLQGSQSHRVMTRSEIPVLVVHSLEAPVAPGDFEPAAYDRVVATTDFSETSRRGLVATLSLTAPFERVEVLFVTANQPPARPASRAEGQLPESTLDRYRAVQTEELRRVLEVVAAEPGADLSRASPHVAFGDTVADGIVDFAAAQGAALIAIPTHGKGRFRRMLFGSTTTRVANLTTLPVLVLPHAWLGGQT